MRVNKDTRDFLQWEHEHGHDRTYVNVKRVIDGDTMIVSPVAYNLAHNSNIEVVVRLAYIDAPEMHITSSRSRRAAPYAREAKHYLTMLTANDYVYLRPAYKDTFESDWYGRVLALVKVPRHEYAICINYELVTMGLASFYWGASPKNAPDVNAYLRAEKQAQKHKLGIWSHRNGRRVFIRPRSHVYHDVSCKLLLPDKHLYCLRRTEAWARAHGMRACSRCH